MKEESVEQIVKKNPFKIRITPKQLDDFFVAKKVNLVCPMCGNEHFKMPTALIPEHVVEDSSSSESDKSKTEWVDASAQLFIQTFVTNGLFDFNLAVAPMVCKKCGYIAQFLADDIEEWVNAEKHSNDLTTKGEDHA